LLFKIQYMIKEIHGDILLSKAEAIAHSVAPMDHFDSGLALKLREDYPSMVKDFRHWCQVFHPKLGEIFLWQSAEKKKVFSMLLQEQSAHAGGHPGAASLSSVRHGLKNLAKQLEKYEVKSLALPRITTGVGGMKWDEVYPLIKEHLDGLETEVMVYTVFQKEVQGEE
jgi:O-acetyl-ADP-ribose deacetylase (regulator of RNase III)